MVRVLSLLTSSKATSTTTSGRDLSRSLMSFCASRSSSGVARITVALWLGTPYSLAFTSRLRRAV